VRIVDQYILDTGSKKKVLFALKIVIVKHKNGILKDEKHNFCNWGFRKQIKR